MMIILYCTASCRTVYSKLSLALLTVPARLRPYITIHTSEAFVSPYYWNTTCFAQLAAIIRCTAYKGSYYPVVTLLHVAFLII
jgi:hypothetical protein